MKKRLITRCLAAAFAAVLASASAQTEAATLLTGLGGPAGFGTNRLPANDDGSSAIIDVSSAFTYGLRFFGTTAYRQLYVNNNGNITFGGPLGTFTPDPFPTASQRMIAAWWGDVDTRGGDSTGVANNGVWWDIRPGQFTATWYRVGYYNSQQDKQNSFQIILRPSPACGNGDFDVEFRYNQCLWTTGSASGGMGGFGGTPAQAGFDAGDRRNFFTLPGSREMAVLNLCTTSNVGDPGVWRFQIRGGELPCTGSGERCTTDQPGACRSGTIQCRGGAPFCVADNRPSPERCDGVDNNCNGLIDEDDTMPDSGVPVDASGLEVYVPPVRDAAVSDVVATDATDASAPDAAMDASAPDVAPDVAPDAVADVSTVDAGPMRLCPIGELCSRGRCIQGCVEGACFEDQTCTADRTCVETSCLTVTCPEGQTCRGGACVDGCAGVVCPMPTTCRFGRCIDACAGVVCDMGQVCDPTLGRCVAGCQCNPCGVGQLCQPDGSCINPICMEEPCPAGQLCNARGRCIDPCEGAVCPGGQTCSPATGRCEDLPDSGPPPRDASADTGDDGGTTLPVADASADGAMDANAPDGSMFPTRPRGCGCRTAGDSHSNNGALAALALAAALSVMARRRNKRA